MPLGIDEMQWLAFYLYSNLMVSLSNFVHMMHKEVWYFDQDYTVDK